MQRELPRLPVIRNLGGCGVTILARVIAALPEVVLLSETNPRSSALYNGYLNPIVQIRKWSPELAAAISTFDEHELGYPPRFGELLECLHSASEKLGRNLVVRDFNYVDFIGIPFVWPVAHASSLDLAVAGRFCLSPIVVVRHPGDQLASLRSHRAIRANLTAEHYLNSYFTFLDAMKGAPLFRYEDIVADPRSYFPQICSQLGLGWDLSALERIASIDQVTGNPDGNKESVIREPRKTDAAALADEELRRFGSYSQLLIEMGYSA
ncbi:hypothetical protein GCM10009641_42050 [Mycobacterium cookii]